MFRYNPESNNQAQQLARRAFEIDPGYARAYGLLSIAIFLAWEFQWTDEPHLLDEAETAVRDGVRIDPDVAVARAWYGWILLWRKEIDLAVAELELAVRNDPDDAIAVGLLAETLNYAGRSEEVPELFQRLMRIDPLYPLNHFFLGHSQYLQGDYEEAIVSLKNMLAFAPDFLPAHRILAAIYADLDRMDEALAAVEEVGRISPVSSAELWRERLPYRDPAVTNRLMASLRKAGVEFVDAEE